MSDTPRSLAELLALAADNTSGNISAQDLRDCLVSLYPSRGALEMYGAPVTTTFTGTGAYKALATTTALDTSVCTTCVTMPANGELRWTKATPQVLLVNASLAVLPSANNKQYSFTFAKNGNPVDALHLTALFGNLQGRPAGVFLSGLVAIEANDIISVVVRADTDTTSIATSVLTLSGIGFIK